MQGTSGVKPPARGGSGRFVPYSTAAKGKKGKAKAKPAELIIKDVCLFPAPDWNQVPRRHIKEDLVNKTFLLTHGHWIKPGRKTSLEASFTTFFIQIICQDKTSKCE